MDLEPAEPIPLTCSCGATLAQTAGGVLHVLPSPTPTPPHHPILTHQLEQARADVADRHRHRVDLLLNSTGWGVGSPTNPVVFANTPISDYHHEQYPK